MNDLQKLIVKYPDKDWYWRGLSNNPNITLDFIKSNYKDNPWMWSEISYNSSMTVEVIEKNINEPKYNTIYT